MSLDKCSVSCMYMKLPGYMHGKQNNSIAIDESPADTRHLFLSLTDTSSLLSLDQFPIANGSYQFPLFH